MAPWEAAPPALAMEPPIQDTEPLILAMAPRIRDTMRRIPVTTPRIPVTVLLAKVPATMLLILATTRPTTTLEVEAWQVRMKFLDQTLASLVDYYYLYLRQ